MKALAPNTLIQNRYLIVQLIGKGGMGEVYLAVDQRLGSAVALKRTFFADDEMLGNAFEREARILARLRHPVLPKVSDHFAENGEQYLVMEHISGDDLSKRLEAAQKPFPSSWVLFWADQLLDALSYLHSHEPPIIHRDIKPQNLKLTDENHIVLLDFGLSKNTTGQTNVTSGSKSSGSVVGYTPHYAPMEQIRGTGTGPRSDLYSLSATLYQLMTNVVPADALSRADSLLNGMADPIQKISDLSPEISPGVSEVILKGMEVSQDKRFSTARDMQKALRKAYTAMQEAMSANTMVYSASDSLQENLPVPAEPVGDYVPTTPPVIDPLPVQQTGASGGFTQPDSNSQPNLDSTVQYNSQADSPVRQADVKTEVYRAGDSPLIAAGFESSTPATPYESNPTPPAENYNPTENYSGDDTGFSPDATVPFISTGSTASAGETAAPEFFTTPNIPSQADPYATVTPSASVEAPSTATAAASAQVAPTAQKPKTKKTSSSKLILALGALGLLLVLGLAAAGGGWYVYNNYYAATASPSPEPTETATPSPSPVPTIDNVNSNSSVNSNSGTNSNQDLTVSPTPFPTTTPQVEDTPTQTRPTPQVRETPTRQSKTPVPRVTPKPVPTRPSILP